MFDPHIYRHRDKYLGSTRLAHSDTTVPLDSGLLFDFRNYARERMNIRHKKNQGEQPPWTDDALLQHYRFCNVYRELDKQTIYIHTRLQHLRDNFPLWLFNIIIARFIAKIETLEAIWICQPGDLSCEERLRAIVWTRYGDAYLFPPQIPIKLWYSDRADFIFNYFPRIISKLARLIETFNNASVSWWVSKITDLLGVWLRFHCTEVLIDVAYQYPHLIDLYGTFPVWPWSKPTMKRFNADAPVENVCLALVASQSDDFPYLLIDGKAMPITAEGIEWLGCEFRKYTNLLNGKGKPRIYHKKPH